MPDKTLVVVESPTKAREVSHILGNGYIVLASFGHVRDLPKNELGVEPPQFSLKYVPTERGGAQLSKIRAAAKGADRILLATDPDREGEAIAWHIVDALRLPARKTARISYNEITEKAVKAAVAKPRSLDMHLVRAQEARRAIDRLVGYIISPALPRGLSAGRVQTPALRLLVERERLIQAHNKVKHFGAELTLPGVTPKDKAWSATWDTTPCLKTGEKYCLDRALASRAAEVQTVVVAGVEKSVRTRQAPAPFTTSTLQQAASSRLNMSPGETMKIAQRLFESTFITYHRTDSVAMADEAVADIRAYAQAQHFPVPSTPNVHKSKGPAVQGAHECIRPTDVWAKTPRGLNAREQALYGLIHQQAVASQLTPMAADVTDVTLESIQTSGDTPFLYKAQAVTTKAPGWSVVFGDAEEKDLPAGIGTGMTFNVTSGRVLELETKPPARYTEAALIKELERRGIGRPSSYASIIETLKTRDYARLQSKILIPTELGIAVADALTQCSFYDLAYTAQMESFLDEMANGQAEYLRVMNDAYNAIEADVGKVGHVTAQVQTPTRDKAGTGRTTKTRGHTKRRKKAVTGTARRKNIATGKTCPVCGGGMVKRTSKFGAFLGCAHYPTCTGKRAA